MPADDPNVIDLRRHIVSLMGAYLAARTEPLKGHGLHGTLRAIRLGVERLPAVASRPNLKVRVSIGMGNWAAVPWVALLDMTETTTTRKGVYVILLFRADMSGFYVTLNQGITQPTGLLGRSAARLALRQRAAIIRGRFPELQPLGFDVASPLDLRTAREFAKELDDSTVAHQLFPLEEVERGTGFVDATANLLAIYDRYLRSPTPLHDATPEKR